MSKAAIAGLILSLMLMATFFFVSGFLSGMQVGWDKSKAHRDDSVVAAKTEPLSEKSPESLSKIASLKTENTHPHAVSTAQAQLQMKKAEIQNGPKHPPVLGKFEHILHKHHRKPAHAPKTLKDPLTVRIGLYPTLSEAQTASQHVKNAGYEPVIHKITIPSQSAKGYRVCAGIFHNQTVAQKSLRAMKNKGFAYATLVPHQGGASSAGNT